MSITVAKRVGIERAIIERLVSDALFFQGYSVSHSDGEAITVSRSRDIAPIMAQLQAYDEEGLIFHDAQGLRVGVVSLVYGNSGYDVIANHTVNERMSALVAGAERLADTLEADAPVMTRSGSVEIAFPRIYAMLKAAGHDPAKAAEILLDARRNDLHARSWIGVIAASRRTSYRPRTAA
jgi:hypothetical protein